MNYNDAFKRVCFECKIQKNEESVLTNALTGNRFDVNKEIRRRRGAINTKFSNAVVTRGETCE
jgi:hypothetical protein